MVSAKADKKSENSDAVAKTVDIILMRALDRGASDIHIEPQERVTVVRYRVDGMLQTTMKLPLTSAAAVSKVVKKLAKLGTNNVATPQDGSFSSSEKLPATFHVATLPTINGEKVAIHIVPQLSEPSTLASLGYWGDGLVAIEQAIADPHGLVIAGSPNRTGASLSLLAMVHLLNDPSLNISTIEDPIAYRIPGINQTQLNAATGITFSAGMKATLRQDPNIIMLSDMHDQEVTDIAIHAALGGRLIMGGLHTHSTISSIKHILHMHVEPFLAAASLRIVVSQHFVRRLCEHCREEYTPNATTRKQLKHLLPLTGLKNIKRLHELEQTARAAKLNETTALSTSHSAIEKLWQKHAGGCAKCNFTGYKGQLGVCEVLPISDAIRKLIAEGATGDIQKQAITEGMVTLALDGLIKALRGLTTLDEVLSIVSSGA